ncbi:BTAD domain-containing putative transcriptional regulator [Streptomyces sp. NPDC004609]|uniref:BTAD domain-containing putative transcriptional regulator n=1 Tax=Streptomyces sp. NPDC004609 TaxID=3364704 RepID=UPI0036CB8DCA
MRFGVLGPVTVWTDAGESVPIPGRKVRALLADLLAHEGRVVSTDRLVEDLWGDRPPGSPAAALQVRVSQLRRALEDAEPGGKHLVVSRAPGYALETSPHTADAPVDSLRFTHLVAAGRLAEALELWRGAAFADFADQEFLAPVIARLEEARLAAFEEHAEACLTTGDALDVAEVAELVAAHPLRERLRGVHMRALYRAGRQSEALAAYGDLRRLIADELGLDPSPHLAELYERILRQDPALSAGSGRPPTNLPAAVGELIGRGEAVAEVRELLGTSRLVTLTGSGGVGKTSLALEVARQSAVAYPDGAWLVELAAAGRRTPSLAETVLAALDIREGPAGALKQLIEAVRGRLLLLVLDNCEHVVEQAAALTETLLRSVPGVRILATSREPLSVAGEALWNVPPLAPPEGSELLTVAKSDAARLFLARAAASARGFTLDERNAAAVAQLCHRLDGIPLALELAATRVRALGVEELVARLDDRFRLLAGIQRGAPARQQTLTAVIDWSWTLLTDAERIILRRLAVHAGGCTLEAAETVCAEEGIDVLDTVARLVDRSLVTVVDGPAGARYRLLESVSAYCLHRLEDAGETVRIRRAHADHYSALAASAEPRLRGPAQAYWLRRLDAESANLRTALDTNLATADGTDPAADALRLVNSLAWYWFLRGRLGEARQSLRSALAAGGPAEETAEARAWYAGFTLLLGDDVRAEGHRNTGADGATRTTATAAESAPGSVPDAIADPGTRARARWFIGRAMTDIPSGRALVARALVDFRAVGDAWGVAAALSSLARDAFTVRDLETLERVSRESAGIFAELGDDWGRMQAEEWLGGLAEIQGDYARAAACFTDGLRTAEELGLWPDAVRRLSWLGWLALNTGDYEDAMKHSGRALRLADGQGYRDGQTFAEMTYGFAARRAGLLELAETCLTRLLDGVPADGEPPLFLPTTLTEMGFLHERRGEPERARALFRRAFAAAGRIGDPSTTAFTTLGLAAVSAPGESARLLGLAAAARRTHRTPAAPSEQHEERRVTDRARAALGDEAFAAAYARGGELTFDDVLPADAP